MDRKFFEKVKREEPWLMHLKDTWVPDSNVLEIEFQRATGYLNDGWVHTDGPDPSETNFKIWVYTINPKGVEKIREVKGRRFVDLSESISKVVNADDSVKRIAWHRFNSRFPERIVIIKPPKKDRPMATKLDDLNGVLQLECYFR